MCCSNPALCYFLIVHLPLICVPQNEFSNGTKMAAIGAPDAEHHVHEITMVGD